jgi:hypothetical protein
MTNEERATMIAKQCLPCSSDFYDGIKRGVKIALDAEAENIDKARKWDALGAEISKCYVDDDGEELPEDEGGDLGDIGEMAASAFGFL